MLIANQYLAFFCFFMGLGCNNPSANPPGIKGDKEFTLSPGQGLTIDGINFYLLDIEDSRCPADVDCYSPGDVTITLKISKGHL